MPRHHPSGPAAPRSVGVLLCSLGCALGAVPLLSGGSAAAASGPASAPAKLVQSSLAAARNEHSVHYTEVSSVGNKSFHLTADVSSGSDGRQTVVVRNGKSVGHVAARYVHQAAYFKGDAPGLSAYLGMPASLAPKYAGKWIAFTSTDQGFAQIKAAFSIQAATTPISFVGHLTESRGAEVDGVKAVAVHGSTTLLSTKGHRGPATLYVATGGSPLPVRYTGEGRRGAGKAGGRADFHFSRWNEHVTVSAPKTSVDASTITG